MAGRSDYSDIMGMKYPWPKRRPAMAMADRAAQFAPFAALTGYGDDIAETERHVDARVELTPEEAERVSGRLNRLHSDPDAPGTVVTVTWFRPDGWKEGGSLRTATGTLAAMDGTRRTLTLGDGTVIPADDVTDVAGEIFSGEDG